MAEWDREWTKLLRGKSIDKILEISYCGRVLEPPRTFPGYEWRSIIANHWFIQIAICENRQYTPKNKLKALLNWGYKH